MNCLVVTATTLCTTGDYPRPTPRQAALIYNAFFFLLTQFVAGICEKQKKKKKPNRTWCISHFVHPI